MQALLAMRVLAVRVATEHLISLWPIAMAELQRALLAPHATRPALLLAACQLIDTVLTVHPDDFSQFGWMFVPQPVAAKAGARTSLTSSSAAATGAATSATAIRSSLSLGPPTEPSAHSSAPPANGALADIQDGGESGAHLASPELSRSSSPPADVGPHAGMPDPTITNAEDAHHANGGTRRSAHHPPTESGTLPALPTFPAAGSRIYQPPSLLAQPSTGAANSLQAAEYVSLLEPLKRLAPTGPEAARPPARRAGLLRPSVDEAAPAAGDAHASARVRPRLLRGRAAPPSGRLCAPPALGRGGPAVARAAPRCEFVSPREAELMLSPHWRDDEALPQPLQPQTPQQTQPQRRQMQTQPPFVATPALFQSRTSDIASRCTPHETL